MSSERAKIEEDYINKLEKWSARWAEKMATYRIPEDHDMTMKNSWHAAFKSAQDAAKRRACWPP